MPRQVIVVFSGTGAQGFSVANALLIHGKYRIRAIAKSTDNRKALLLRGKGADLVRANLDNFESCKSAVKDAYGVFLVTNFWEHRDVGREFKQGKNVVDACIEEGVKHLIFSGQEHVMKMRGYPCRKYKTQIRWNKIYPFPPPDKIRLSVCLLEVCDLLRRVYSAFFATFVNESQRRIGSRTDNFIHQVDNEKEISTYRLNWVLILCFVYYLRRSRRECLRGYLIYTGESSPINLDFTRNYLC